MRGSESVFQAISTHRDQHEYPYGCQLEKDRSATLWRAFFAFGLVRTNGRAVQGSKMNECVQSEHKGRRNMKKALFSYFLQKTGVFGIAAAVAALVWSVSCGGSEQPGLGVDEEPAGAPVVASAPPAPREPVALETPDDDRSDERERMLETIRRYGVTDRQVLDAMERVRRHEFVPDEHRRHAYSDGPLPIGYGQTISQPFIVAEMTRLLALKEDATVLEVGTGSGYQAAVLAEITPHVYTIEIIEPLAESAAKRLKDLGYDTVRVRHGDGFYGWEEAAPFDAIMVTAAAGQIPPPLIEQLKPGGLMVIPVGGPFAVQTLMLVDKDEDGRVTSRDLMSVRFVPLTRDEAAGR